MLAENVLYNQIAQGLLLIDKIKKKNKRKIVQKENGRQMNSKI